MLKETVTYVDFNGENQSEELFFHLMKHEMTDLAYDLPKSISEALGEDPTNIDTNAAAAKLIDTMGGRGILEFTKELLLRSYGIKSEDGKQFIKTKEIREAFAQSLAFDAMLDMLMSDDAKAKHFMESLIPTPQKSSIPAKSSASKK